ncbi:hypothetical protein CesoFtcFv8_023492 [Champsocephalus esox]|uniref:Uncharacterized protein n=1 Tax=Champsocephalus esox TaxID=159716 RepID=A0AAN8B8D6_9TELE|nr:hypothetical protein CesoFtcFv8_023492 [Champsocephalus esox]
MALSDASGDSVALGNGGHHNLSANGNGPSNSSTPVSSGQDPLTAADSLPNGDQEVVVKDGGCKVQQRSHVVQRTNRPSQNGSVVKQNSSPRNLPPSSPKRHVSSSLSQSSSSHSLQPPPLCCQHCHFHSPLCCPCGQQDCPLFQNPGTGPGSGTASSCPCCLSACTYSHPHAHPAHPSSPLCLQHLHQQRWQEHLQNQTPGIR